MSYFISEEERQSIGGTCYFEFQKGQFQNKHWLKDSMLLHADTFDSLHLYTLFSKAIEGFYYYGPNEVSNDQWNLLVTYAKENEQWNHVIEELAPWAEKCLADHNNFFICGI